MGGNRNMPPSKGKSKVLVIDDDVETQDIFSMFLEDEGYIVKACPHPLEAFKVLDRFAPDCIILDLRMPHMSGEKALRHLRERKPSVPVVIVSADTSVQRVEDCMRMGAIGYVTKPVDLDHFLKEIRFALEQREKELQKKDLDQEKEDRQALFVKHKLFQKLEASLSLMEIMEPSLISHSRHVAWLCKHLAEDLIPDQVDLCEFSGWFHDVGKLRFPKTFHNTPFMEMTADQQKAYKNYPIHGQDLLETIFDFKEVAKIIRHQNENFNGTGYPDQLRRNEIPIASRILAVANDFIEEIEKSGNKDFMRSMEAGKTFVGRLFDPKAGRFDPDVINALLKFIEKHKYSGLREQKISLEQLRSGMVLSRSLRTESGIFLYSEDTTLTEMRIQVIRDLSLIDMIPQPIYIYFSSWVAPAAQTSHYE